MNYDDDKLWQQAEEKVQDCDMHTSFCDRDKRDFTTRVMETYQDMLSDIADADFERLKEAK